MQPETLPILPIDSGSLHHTLARLKPALQTADPALHSQVQAILQAVREKGDDALLDYTARFDRLTLPDAGALRIPPQMIAEARIAPEVETALQRAAERIRAFHARLLPPDLDYRDESGARLGLRWKAVKAAGLYVPGGTATYPSTVLMNAIPARTAGVERLVMTVPTPDGVLNPILLVAARIAGIDEIYRIGGAQAVGALAYGTESIAPVDVIVGPGNRYVAEAKRQVYGTVGIDAIAGPSDILVAADDSADPAWVAADLLSQAEHDPDASAILVTASRRLAEAVKQQAERQLADLPRREIATAALQRRSAILLAESESLFPAVIDAIAPEHLELSVADPDALFARITHAGAVFLGHWTSEILGDYVAGPSHVLPTEGTARFASGLSVWDFLKRSTFMQFDEAAFRQVAEAAERLAGEEGLEAHARSIRIRREGTL